MNPTLASGHLTPRMLQIIEAMKKALSPADIDKIEGAEIHLRTSDTGDLGAESPGRDDLVRFKGIRDAMEKAYPEVHGAIDFVNEWTCLTLRVYPQPLPPRAPSKSAISEAVKALVPQAQIIAQRIGRKLNGPAGTRDCASLIV